MRTSSTLAVAALIVAAASPVTAQDPAELSAAVLERCREALPKSLSELPSEGEMQASGEAGEWRIETGRMDAAAPVAFLVAQPAGRPGEVTFVADREGKSPFKKNVDLEGAPVRRVLIRFETFREGASLAHVDAGEGGQVLLHWNGKKLSRVWEVGQSGTGERHWFEIEDVDDDGVAEVIAYFRLELDDFYEDDELEQSGGADERAGSGTGAMAVFRYEDGKWKKDKELLEGLR